MVGVLLLAMLAVAVAAWTIHARLTPPAWRTSSVMVGDLRKLSAGMAALEENLRLAEEVARIGPDVREERITVYEERAAYQRDVCSLWLQEAGEVGRTMAPLADIARLVAQSSLLVKEALSLSPTRPVAASRAATAPVLSADPQRTGVLPGVQQFIEVRAAQLRHEAARIGQRGEQSVLRANRLQVRLWGLSARQWLLTLCVSAAVLGLFACVSAFRSLTIAPQALLEARVRNATRKDLRKGIEVCYEHVDHLLNLADRITRNVR